MEVPSLVVTGAAGGREATFTILLKRFVSGTRHYIENSKGVQEGDVKFVPLYPLGITTTGRNR